MVFTIGYHDDSLADAFLLCEAVHRLRDGKGDVCALGGNKRWLDVGQEHLCRHVVARDWQLDKRISGKDDKSYLVVGEVVNEILHHHLAAVETTRSDILCEHRVTDVHGDDCLDALALLMTDLGAKLWTGEHDDDEGKSSLKQPELHRRAP